jgi:hypothetical protein
MWTLSELSDVDVVAMAAWIAKIPLGDWPQQRPLDDGQLRPSMVTSPDWYGFHYYFHPGAYQHMLSVVMPGHSIEPHQDQQPDYWQYRVHIPLLTSPGAVIIMDDGEHHLEVGKSYKMNTRATHAIANRGATPRIHYMFDVR